MVRDALSRREILDVMPCATELGVLLTQVGTVDLGISLSCCKDVGEPFPSIQREIGGHRSELADDFRLTSASQSTSSLDRHFNDITSIYLGLQNGRVTGLYDCCYSWRALRRTVWVGK